MTTATHSHPGAIMARLEEIEKDLAERQNPFEQAADDRARLLRDWEKRLAICGRTAKGQSADIRKASALCAAIEADDLHERLADAEARYEALRSVTGVLEKRSLIGMAILKAQGRA